MNDENMIATNESIQDVSSEKWHHKAVIAVSVSVYALVLGTVLLTNSYQSYMSSAYEADGSGLIIPTPTSYPSPTIQPCATPTIPIRRVELPITLAPRPTPPPGTRIAPITPTQGMVAPWPTKIPVTPTPTPTPEPTSPCP